MIFGVDEDCIVRTRRHAGFAADADRFIEIDDAVGALEHRGRRTGGDTGSVSALITAGHLMRAASLRKNANVDMLHIGARDGKRNQILRLACGGAGVATNASCVVDDLGPLHRAVLWFFKH